jgi:hypothetical protein
LPEESVSGQLTFLEDTGHIDKLRRIRDEYFTADADTRNRLQLEFFAVQKEMFKKTIDDFKGTPSKRYAFLSRWEPFDSSATEWFDSEWMFGVAKFDIVIANPPYVDSEEMVRSSGALREYCVEHYKSACGNWDLFVPFVELGYILVQPNGCFVFIIPNKLIAAAYAKSLREIIKRYIVELRDYSMVRVFKEADVYPITMIANLYNNEYLVNDVKMTTMQSVESINGDANYIKPCKFIEAESWDVFFASDNRVLSIIDKMNNKKKIDTFADVRGAATVSEAYEIKKYLADDDKISRKTTTVFKFINTGTIDRYTSLWGIKPTQYIKGRYIFPVIDNAELKRVYPQRFHESHLPKIVIGGMTKILECFLDDEGSYLAGKSTTIVFNSSIDLRYVIGLLNSRLMSFYYSTMFNSLSLSGGFFRIGPPQIKQLPLAVGSKAQVNAIVELVSQRMTHDLSVNKLTEIESEIDRKVYEINGLTNDEIELIEGDYSNVEISDE